MPQGIKSGLMARLFKAVRQLNPDRTAKDAERRFTLALIGSSEENIHAMRRFLLGPNPSQQEIARAERVLRAYTQPLDESQQSEIRKADIVLVEKGAESGLPRLGAKLFEFDMQSPQSSVTAILGSDAGTDLRLPIARYIPAFRLEVARRVIRDISKENAVFVIGTALGDVIPSPLLPLIGIAEAASDTVFLTANQVRMLFNLGAMYGVNVGYVSQWKEVSSIVGAAFGWRTIARELISKIPFGGGLVPKAAIAYAGTFAVGEGLIFFYTTGRHMTREETAQAFKDAYSRAGDIVRSLVTKFRPGGAEDEGNIPSTDVDS